MKIDNIPVTITTNISLERISCLLCSALEGGSNYWYCITEFVEPTYLGTEKGLDFQTDSEEIFKHLDYPLNEGGALLISDQEGDEEYSNKRLDLFSIKKGLQTMADNYPAHFQDFLQENDDACTGDVFLQCCLFGEVIFG